MVKFFNVAVMASAREYLETGYEPGFQFRAFRRAVLAVETRSHLVWWEDLEAMRETIRELPDWKKIEFNNFEIFEAPLRRRLLKLFRTRGSANFVDFSLKARGSSPARDKLAETKRGYARLRARGLDVRQALCRAYFTVLNDEHEGLEWADNLLAQMAFIAIHVPKFESWIVPEVAERPEGYLSGYFIGRERNELQIRKAGVITERLNPRWNPPFGMTRGDMRALFVFLGAESALD